MQQRRCDDLTLKMHGICDNTTTLELLDGVAGTVHAASRLDRVDNVLRRPAGDADGVQATLLLVCGVSYNTQNT